MERKTITIKNSLQQEQEFIIDAYDDHIEFQRLLSDEIEDVSIPEEIEGLPVTVIGDDCFFARDIIRSISLPNTVTRIGEQAFAMCKGLTELILPDSIVEIGSRAFRDCRGLKKVILPKKLKSLPVGVFSFCNLVDPEIVLPDELEVIEDNAFWCAGVFDLIIPDSVKQIGVGAFYWGPKPITKLPPDKGWYLLWPYGEAVEGDDFKGIVTDIHSTDGGYRIHEVTANSTIKYYFYPCDYMDGKLRFSDEKNQHWFDRDVEQSREIDADLSKAYGMRDAWLAGLARWEK